MGYYFDSAVAAVDPRVRGLVSDGVLIADVMRHGAADLVDLFQVLREEGHTACLEGERFQGPLGAPFVAFATQDADGVYRGAVVILHRADRLLQRFPALV